MAEPESILQLGIEAAREHKKEEARQLFRLLTRQEPDNVQGWLWLAGVAENREERQASLERVLELDPGNEMALKGLQALGVRPGAAPAAAVAAAAVAPPPAPPPAPALAEDVFADDPFAELNNLSDVMAEDTSGPVRRSETAPIAAESYDRDAALVGAAAAAGSTFDDRGAKAYGPEAAPPGRSDYKAARYVEDDELEPPRQGISPLLGLLLFLVGLGLIGLLLFSLFGNNRVAQGNREATAAALTAGPSLRPTDALGGAGAIPGATADVNATPAPVDVNATPAPVDVNATPVPGTEQPTAAPLPPTDAELAGANPAILPPNTPIQSQGWVYDFPQATYAGSIIGNLGQFTPTNGRFVVVLIHAINSTGAPAAVPADFFVLKDAQGRIWKARPEVSDAYVVPGVNADQSHTTPLPPDGNYRSVALVFDVAPDATDLTFFARSNPAQGWIVLRSV